MWTNDVMNGARSRSNASRTRFPCSERGARSRRSGGPGCFSKKSSQLTSEDFFVPRQKSASETTWSSSQRRALHTHAEVRLTSTSLSSRYAPTCFFSLRAPRTPPSRAAGPAPRRERMPGPHVGILSTLFADSAIGVVSRASRARCRPSRTPPSRSWPIAARRTARAKKRDAPRTPSLPPPPTLTPSDPILATRHGISRHQPS